MQDTARNSFVIRVTLVATLGGFLFGYDTAVVSGAINAIRDFLVIPFAGNTHGNVSSITGFTVSSALIGCILGGAAAGFISLRAGRKGGMMLAAILFLLSGIGAAFPEIMSFLGMDPLVSFIFYRIIGGVGIGLASMLSPMYIAEIAPADIRGKLVSWNQFAIVSGILIVYFVNWFIARHGDEQWNMTTGWRYMFLSGAIPSLLFIFLLFFIPETPRFLVLKKRNDQALKVLGRTVGNEAEAHLKEISYTLVEKSAPWLSFGAGVIVTGILLAAFQQFIGINVVLYYAPKIFQNTGTKLDISLLQTILVGAVNLLFTVIAIFTVDKLGRKPLLIAGGLIMGIAMAAIGFTFYGERMGIAALIFILLYIAGFAMSWGPVMWVLLSEIFPNSIRSAMSLATATVWIADLIISWTFPVLDDNAWLTEKFHHGFAYWIYALICILAVIFVWKKIPETKGKTLEQIEKLVSK
jgi:SP family xylose:H+ symportor-like MFS transporter